MQIENVPQPPEDTIYDTCEVCDMSLKSMKINVLFAEGKIEDTVFCICDKCVQSNTVEDFEWLTDNKVIINQFIKLKQ